MPDQATERKEPESISTDQARPKLGELLERVRFEGESFVLTRFGKPMAALVPLSVIERSDEAA